MNVTKNIQILDGTKDGRIERNNLQELFRKDCSNEVGSVISIVGPQNTGKSTLLNQIFGTNFKVAPEELSFEQTTVGVWASRCIDTNMIIMDVEGSDSSNRIEDGATFESRSALLALTISSAMLLNIAADFSQTSGGCKTLIRRIFKARLNPGLELVGKTKLIVVLRDVNDLVTITNAYPKVIRELEQTWQEVHGKSAKDFNDYLEVSVEALPHRVHDITEFQNKCSEFKTKLLSVVISGCSMAPKRIARHFPDLAEIIWDDIKKDAALSIPGIEDLMSNSKANDILEEITSNLKNDKEPLGKKHLALKSTDDKSFYLESFKAGYTDLQQSAATMYDAKATCISVQRIKDKKRIELQQIVSMEVKPTFQTVFSTKFQLFKEALRTYVHIQIVDDVPDDKIICRIKRLLTKLLEDFPDEYQEFANKNYGNELQKHTAEQIQLSHEWLKTCVRYTVDKVAHGAEKIGASLGADGDNVYLGTSNLLGANLNEEIFRKHFNRKKRDGDKVAYGAEKIGASLGADGDNVYLGTTSNLLGANLNEEIFRKHFNRKKRDGRQRRNATKSTDSDSDYDSDSTNTYFKTTNSQGIPLGKEVSDKQL